MEELEDMEMPCPCSKCGDWFDLTDGFGSKKWFPNTVICEPCFLCERDEITVDEEEQNLLISIGNSENIRESKKRLIEIGRPFNT